jgi:hypothetical protein
LEGVNVHVVFDERGKRRIDMVDVVETLLEDSNLHRSEGNLARD